MVQYAILVLFFFYDSRLIYKIVFLFCGFSFRTVQLQELAVEVRKAYIQLRTVVSFYKSIDFGSIQVLDKLVTFFDHRAFDVLVGYFLDHKRQGEPHDRQQEQADDSAKDRYFMF
ncbi:hypothetical protein D3C86_1346510 [compost metagenome]